MLVSNSDCVQNMFVVILSLLFILNTHASNYLFPILLFVVLCLCCVMLLLLLPNSLREKPCLGRNVGQILFFIYLFCLTISTVSRKVFSLKNKYQRQLKLLVILFTIMVCITIYLVTSNGELLIVQHIV